MTLVRALLDLATRSEPVRLERVVPLEDHLEAEALRRVPDLLAPEHLHAAFNVLARHLGFDLFDPHEVLFVERTQAIDAALELRNVLFDLGRLHAPSSYRNGPGVERLSRGRSPPVRARV